MVYVIHCRIIIEMQKMFLQKWVWQDRHIGNEIWPRAVKCPLISSQYISVYAKCHSQKSGTSFEESKVGKDDKWLRCMLAVANKWKLNADIWANLVGASPQCKHRELSVVRKQYLTLGNQLMLVNQPEIFLDNHIVLCICYNICWMQYRMYVHAFNISIPNCESTGG